MNIIKIIQEKLYNKINKKTIQLNLLGTMLLVRYDTHMAIIANMQTSSIFHKIGNWATVIRIDSINHRDDHVLYLCIVKSK